MTKRAMLWCGYIKPPLPPKDPYGRPIPDPDFPDCDFPASVNDLEIALRAARSLGVNQSEIYAFVCSDDLLPRDFGPPPFPATLAALRTVTTTIARNAASDDALLFIATNHGLEDGLLTSEPVDEFSEGDAGPHLLTPDALDACLEPLSGPQVLVVAACHAGTFLRLGQRADRIVVTSCAATEKYDLSRGEVSRSPFLAELFESWCGVTLGDSRPPVRRPLHEAVQAAEKRLAESYKTTKPQWQGSAIWPH